MLAVLHARQDLTFRRSIALQFISDDHAWDVLEPYAEPKLTIPLSVMKNLTTNL